MAHWPEIEATIRSAEIKCSLGDPSMLDTKTALVVAGAVKAEIAVDNCRTSWSNYVTEVHGVIRRDEFSDNGRIVWEIRLPIHPSLISLLEEKGTTRLFCLGHFPDYYFFDRITGKYSHCETTGVKG